MQILKQKKGDVGNLSGLAWSIVTLVIVVAIGAIVLNNFKATISDNTSTAYTTISSGESALGEFGNWFKVIIIVGIAAVIFFLFLRFRGVSQ